MKEKLSKSLAIIMLILTIFSAFSNIVCATEITGAELHNGGDCGQHLQYWKDSINNWSFVETTYVYYNENGAEYPAYCLQSDLPGVGKHEEYGVDVSTLMDDVRLWRVALNGYPYQTPESMGVANKYDAFVATKQAIYSVLYNTDVESYYNGADAQGVAIKNAIKNLTELGRNGTQTPANTDIEVKKLEGFYEDGEYYSQNYLINSPVETAQYTIIATNGMPEGSRITDLTGNEKTTFSGNESFKVSIPKSKFDKDINITISVKGKAKTYPMFYGKTRVAGTQDYLLTYDPFGDVVGQTSLNVETNTGKVQIHKVDSDTSEPLEEIEFALYKEDGTEVGKAKTNKDGIAIFQGLYQGKYYLKELSTNENYIINEENFDVDVSFNKTTDITIKNEYKKGNIKVLKVDKDNNEIGLENITFDLYSEETDEIIGSYSTNDKGEILIENLRIGKYKLVEKDAGKWYNLAEDINVEVKWNETTEVTVENEKKKGQIRVIKTDGETETPLKDVTFAVKNFSGDIVEKITTNEKGEATTERLPIDEQYTIYEESTQKGYILSDEQQTVELEENEIKTLEFKNYKEKGKIKIIKKSSDGKNIEGIEFKVIGTTLTGENFERTYKTDSNGEIFIDEALVGEYTIEEIVGDINKNYEIPAPQTVTVEKDKTVEVEFYNELKNKHVADKGIENQTPNTGDNRAVAFAGVVSIISIAGITVLTIKKIKDKKNK